MAASTMGSYGIDTHLVSAVYCGVGFDEKTPYWVSLLLVDPAVPVPALLVALVGKIDGESYIKVDLQLCKSS
jgi:hypothetical protein